MQSKNKTHFPDILLLLMVWYASFQILFLRLFSPHTHVPTHTHTFIQVFISFLFFFVFNTEVIIPYRLLYRQLFKINFIYPIAECILFHRMGVLEFISRSLQISIYVASILYFYFVTLNNAEIKFISPFVGIKSWLILPQAFMGRFAGNLCWIPKIDLDFSNLPRLLQLSQNAQKRKAYSTAATSPGFPKCSILWVSADLTITHWVLAPVTSHCLWQPHRVKVWLSMSITIHRLSNSLSSISFPKFLLNLSTSSN